jgi:hypothetical protein
MRPPFSYIIIILIFLLLSSFFSIDVNISGNVYKANSNQPAKRVKLFVKYQGKIIAKTKTDTLGHYEITINVGLANGLKNTYDFYIVNVKNDTCFTKSIRQFKSDDVTLNIKLPINCN